MNIEIICTLLTGIATVACACIACADRISKTNRQKREAELEELDRVKFRENQLFVAMVTANTSLTVTLAKSIMDKSGIDDEIVDAVNNVEKAIKEYVDFGQQTTQKIIYRRV